MDRFIQMIKKDTHLKVPLNEVNGLAAEDVSGDIFKVKYLGRTDIPMNGSERARDILSRYSMKRLKNLPTQELIIDSSSITLRSGKAQTRPPVSFTIPLFQVRDVTYRKKEEQYRKCCVFIAQESNSATLTAHVVACDSTEEVAKMVKSCQTAFENGNPKAENNLDSIPA